MGNMINVYMELKHPFKVFSQSTEIEEKYFKLKVIEIVHDPLFSHTHTLFHQPARPVIACFMVMFDQYMKWIQMKHDFQF